MNEFNKIHNPDYYYDKKTQAKKTQTEKKTRRTYAAKRHPVFKVSDWVDGYSIWFGVGYR